ncbi:MAG: hypothetical protein HY360_21765 [Verrucomicrobia bacterium]|nr:hypothetical protein [Verrucomicrobiota bacterium]
MNDSLADIAREQDAKISAYLRKRERTRFWYAGCGDASLPQLHALGFDNYPLAKIAFKDPIFFFERILGCSTHVLDGQAGSFFHTWCQPMIESPGDIRQATFNLETNETWQTYLDAVARYADAGGDLPVGDLAFYPLDLASNLCGTERFFTWMIDAPEHVEFLFDRISDLYLETRRRLLRLGIRLVNHLGFPCVYCSDLQLPYLSPPLVERFILPQYERVARECGGMFLALLQSNMRILERVMATDAILGCSFDKRLPLEEIKRRIGRKLFVLDHYLYDDALDRPTCRDGTYWNPIVQDYSREIEEVFRVLGGTTSLITCIERPSLHEVLGVRDGLSRYV